MMRRFGPRVFQVARRFFHQSTAVEDAAQEIFLKAFSALDGFSGSGSLEGWLTRIATNTCLNLVRGAGRRPELATADLTQTETDWLDQSAAAHSGREHTVEDRLAASDLAGRLLESLSAEDRLVVMMIDGEEASIKEVAASTGWSESKVKVRAFRARKKMREAVEKLLSAGRSITERAGKGREKK
ncbi:MAG: RNA polymerase sigma factor [Pyrinomonadaceae bacterium]